MKLPSGSEQVLSLKWALENVADLNSENAMQATCEVFGIAFEESRLELDDLAAADEVYISNAVIGLIPVTKILKIREDYPGVKGSKLIEIRKAYRRFLESTIT